ncbi:MAG: QueT transporter family protein [Christensenellales bacterium]|jgi:uncharacterized membrane protein
MRNGKRIARAGMIAALYAALTLIAQPISFGYGGMFQMRISEMLTILPVLTPTAVWGLTAGCLVANIVGGGTVLDIIFGTLATLLAAVATRLLRTKPFLASLMPTVFNTLIVGAVLCQIVEGFTYPMAMLSVVPGEFAAATGLGLLLLRVLPESVKEGIRE